MLKKIKSIINRCGSGISVRGGGASEILPTTRSVVSAAAKDWASKLGVGGGGPRASARSAPNIKPTSNSNQGVAVKTKRAFCRCTISGKMLKSIQLDHASHLASTS